VFVIETKHLLRNEQPYVPYITHVTLNHRAIVTAERLRCITAQVRWYKLPMPLSFLLMLWIESQVDVMFEKNIMNENGTSCRIRR
jgi:hypothetical protein